MLSRSSRPTGNTRARVGTKSVTVRRPRASVTALSTPAGLFSSQYSLTSAAMGRPSTAMTWVSGSADAPSSASTPSTVTRPALISSSLARREAKPASARAFCSRIFTCAPLGPTRERSAGPDGGVARPSGPRSARSLRERAVRPGRPARRRPRTAAWCRKGWRRRPPGTADLGDELPLQQLVDGRVGVDAPDLRYLRA